jgi:quercetin dioxygenase-like cupin family protein
MDETTEGAIVTDSAEARDDFEIENLDRIEDAAPGIGLGEVGEARFASGQMGLEQTGFSFYRLKPGKRQPFGHRHDAAEEVYLVLAGSGRVKLDEQVREIGRLDAIRVAPPVVRSFEAGPEGLEVLVFGARFEGDGELLHGWWTD